MTTYVEMTNAEKIADWRESNPEKQLTHSVLLGILNRSNLWDTDLSYADLRNAVLSYADLRGADLRYADLRGVYLTDADLRGAYLTDADLWGADLSGANLSGANLRGADLYGAYWEGLQITGLPSGQIVLTPTPDGWELRVGCWTGTIDGLHTLIAQDEGWPEAKGQEITRRRPGLQAALALIDAHIALHPSVINELKTKWGAK